MHESRLAAAMRLALCLWLLMAATGARGLQLGGYGAPFGPQQIARDMQSHHNNILHFEVSENAPVGTLVGQILSNENQPPKMILPMLGEVSESERKQYFTINLLTGEIHTNNALDRESREHYKFAATTDNKEIVCTIKVLDVNDNSPQFWLPHQTSAPPVNNVNMSATAAEPTGASATPYVIEIFEGAGQTPSRWPLPVAIDYDSSQFGLKEFRLTKSPGGFAQGSSQQNTFYQTFIITDFGASEASVNESCNQHLAISKLNSQPHLQMIGAANNKLLDPSFSSTSFFGGSNPKIMELLVPNMQTPRAQQQVELVVCQELDREAQPSYQLELEAMDGGNPPLIGRLKLNIVVRDINDNEPQFNQSVYEVILEENAPVGTHLTRVQASDADLDKNAQVSYSIRRHLAPSTWLSGGQAPHPFNLSIADTSGSPPLSQAQAQTISQQLPSKCLARASNKAQAQLQQQVQPPMFTIDSASGDIKLVGQLDYETDSCHELLVEARDHGKPPRSGYAIVRVYVKDVVDDPPMHPSVHQGYSSSPLSRGQTIDSSGRLISNGGHTTAAVSMHPSIIPQMMHEEGPGPLGALGWIINGNYGGPSGVQQSHGTIVFAGIFIVLMAISMTVCAVKIMSRQPQLESMDYTDSMGKNASANNNGNSNNNNSNSMSRNNNNGAGGGKPSPSQQPLGAHDQLDNQSGQHMLAAGNYYNHMNPNGSIANGYFDHLGGGAAGTMRGPPVAFMAQATAANGGTIAASRQHLMSSANSIANSQANNLYYNPCPRPRHSSSHIQDVADESRRRAHLGGSAGNTMTVPHHPSLLMGGRHNQHLQHHHQHDSLLGFNLSLPHHHHSHQNHAHNNGHLNHSATTPHTHNHSHDRLGGHHAHPLHRHLPPTHSSQLHQHSQHHQVEGDFHASNELDQDMDVDLDSHTHTHNHHNHLHNSTNYLNLGLGASHHRGASKSVHRLNQLEAPEPVSSPQNNNNTSGSHHYQNSQEFDWPCASNSLTKMQSASQRGGALLHRPGHHKSEHYLSQRHHHKQNGLELEGDETGDERLQSRRLPQLHAAELDETLRNCQPGDSIGTSASRHGRRTLADSSSPLPDTPTCNGALTLAMARQSGAGCLDANNNLNNHHDNKTQANGSRFMKSSSTSRAPTSPLATPTRLTNVLSSSSSGCVQAVWSQSPQNNLTHKAPKLVGGGGGGLDLSPKESAANSQQDLRALACGGGATALDSWAELDLPTQPIYAPELCSSYSWDYLADWLPDYEPLVNLLRQESSSTPSSSRTASN